MTRLRLLQELEATHEAHGFKASPKLMIVAPGASLPRMCVCVHASNHGRWILRCEDGFTHACTCQQSSQSIVCYTPLIGFSIIMH